MEVLQYIYTSWKNGDSTEKGYMIYSRSEGVTEAECVAIKDAMQYLAPKELNLAPTPEEIADVFPYSFSYFVLPTGRGCVAQSTYLGRDYSGRFGNYIIYAMIFDTAELTCRPSEFFGESYIKTAMTQEELNASSPVPPLPPLSVDEYGSVINDEQLNEFVFDKEDEFSQIIAMVLKARDLGVPFYLNDTRENLVLWSAAIQRIFSLQLSKKFTFNTYMYDQEVLRSARVKEEGLYFCLVGVRPDANYFSYATECKSNRHLVMDFIGGYMSEGVEPTIYSAAMASSLAMDCEEIDSFGDFIDSTTFNEINGRLQDAYLYYRLLKYNDYEHSEENLRDILSFGTNYCSETDNSDVGGKLLAFLQENSCAISPEIMKIFWAFISKYASYMIFTLYDLLQETLFQYSGEATEPCVELDALLDEIEQDMPQQYKEYLGYVNSVQSIDHLMLYLEGHENLYTNRFYIKWILKNYNLKDLLTVNQPVSKLFITLLKNISGIDGSEKMMVEMLIDSSTSQIAFEVVLRLFSSALRDSKKLERLCSCYIEVSNDLSEDQANKFERLLIEIPVAMPLAVQVFARKIASAKKTDEEFWRFYEQHRTRIVSNANFSIDPLARACLNSLDVNQRQEAAVDMIGKLDLNLFREASTITLITDTINECSFKFLTKVDNSILQRACELRNNISATGLEKIKAILIGQKIDNNYSQGRRPTDLSAEMANKEVSLAYFDKSDYEAYTKNYFAAYYSLLNSSEDVSVLMGLFYHQQYFADFVSDYVSAVKKMEKKEQSRWMRIVTWTCVYLISASNDDPAADVLYKPMIHYLRSLDEHELINVRQEVIKDVPRSRCDQLFDEVHRKEGFSEKFSGFFRRK